MKMFSFFREFFHRALFSKSVPVAAVLPDKKTSGAERENSRGLSSNVLDDWKRTPKFPVKEEEWIGELRHGSLDRVATESASRIFQAIRMGTEISFNYGTGSNPGTPRRLKPESIFRNGSVLGPLYVSGFCYMRNEQRTFRVERMTRVTNPDADGKDTFDRSRYDALCEEREKRDEKLRASNRDALEERQRLNRQEQEAQLEARKKEAGWSQEEVARIRALPVVEMQFAIGETECGWCDFFVVLGDTSLSCSATYLGEYPSDVLLCAAVALHVELFTPSISRTPEEWQPPFSRDIDICDEPSGIVIRMTVFEERIYVKLFECADLLFPENPPEKYILRAEGVVDFWQFADAVLDAVINSLARDATECIQRQWTMGWNTRNSVIPFAHLIHLARIVEAGPEKAKEYLPPLTFSQELAFMQKILEHYTGDGEQSIQSDSKKPSNETVAADAFVVRNGEPFRIPDLDLEMMPIPAGSFMMGTRRVTLTKPFRLGKYPVTQGQYEKLMGENPSEFRAVGANAPVENVSWEDAMAFCRKINERERAAGRLLDGYEYTLPTEAQWEYACRAGTTTPFNTGDNLTTAQANYNGNATTKVGSFSANAWDLCDMHGNVWEWCLDWWCDYFRHGEVTNPVGPRSGGSHVVRGGSWGNAEQDCRSAHRSYGLRGYCNSCIGFRLALAFVGK